MTMRLSSGGGAQRGSRDSVGAGAAAGAGGAEKRCSTRPLSCLSSPTPHLLSSRDCNTPETFRKACSDGPTATSRISRENRMRVVEAHLGRSRQDRNGHHGVHGDHREGRGPVRRVVPGAGRGQPGATVEEATSNLRKAVELFLECADAEEIKRRRRTDIFVTRIEAKHG